jgi:hypothetical protein
LRAYTKEVQSLISELQEWAPRLLEGEALINFLVDNLLRPLLAAAGDHPWARRQAWSILPDLIQALGATSGNKHATHVAVVATLLAQQLAGAPPDGDVRQAAESFLAQIWQVDAKRGIWQMVHSIEGSIPLLLALEGPQTLVAIARAASEKERLWGQ